MPADSSSRLFFKGFVAWVLRIIAAGVLAFLSSAGVCRATEFFLWSASDYVCGHNAVLMIGLLFIIFWVFLEFALPKLLRGKC